MPRLWSYDRKNSYMTDKSLLTLEVDFDVLCSL